MKYLALVAILIVLCAAYFNRDPKPLIAPEVVDATPVPSVPATTTPLPIVRKATPTPWESQTMLKTVRLQPAGSSHGMHQGPQTNAATPPKWDRYGRPIGHN